MPITIPASTDEASRSPLRVVGLAHEPELDPITRHLTFGVELNRWPTETERRYLALDFGPHSRMGVTTQAPIANGTPHLRVSLEDAQNLDDAVSTLKQRVKEASTQGAQTDASATSELETVKTKLRDLLAES